MVIVAVAGGTSAGLGRAIVTALKAEHDLIPIVLTRSTSSVPQWLSSMDVESRAVDYGSHGSLVQALQGVHTVISVVLPRDGDWATNQIALLNAGLEAGIKRFAPSEFSAGSKSTPKIAMLRGKMQVWDACEEVAKANAGFEWARFNCGFFMNYFGHGAPKQEEALAGVADFAAMWDIPKMTARFPIREDGGMPRMTMTDIRDVGRFVAAACALPQGKWRKDMEMVGDTVRPDEVTQLIEQLRARKMSVTGVKPSEMERNESTAQDPMAAFWHDLWEMWARDELGEGYLEPTVNRLCPQVKPMSVEEYLKAYWSES